MSYNFNKTLLVINPSSKQGQGKYAGEKAHNFFLSQLKMGGFRSDFKLDTIVPVDSEHAIKVAANSKKYDTVIALGGDGVVHEVVQGLMQIKKENRPVLGVIPTGSGNDFAKSLNLDKNLDKCLEQYLTIEPYLTDIGLVNGVYFTETLSFGIDAAIALSSRLKCGKNYRTGRSLYFRAGLYQFLHHYDCYNYNAIINDQQEISGCALSFAVQNGKTYGGGFKICPYAEIDDGVLDICIGNGKMNRLVALWLFNMAKNAKHINNPNVMFKKAKKIKINFESKVPCQVDGEALDGDEFEVTVIKHAINVLRFKAKN